MFFEAILALLGLLLILALLGCVFGLPIFAAIRAYQVGRRLDQLEREVRRLRHDVASTGERAADDVQVAIAAQVPVVAAVAETVPTEPIPVEPVEPPTKAPPAGLDLSRLEEWIGARGLGWAAVILVLFAAAFFLKVIIDRDLIGELGRVALGLTAGVGLCGAGWWTARRGWRLFSQMLTAAGILLVYLMVYASFGYYHLASQARGSIYLGIVIAEAFALALVYNAPALALIATAGGLLMPVLLHTDQDRYASLFTYLVLLDTGAVLLALFRRWWVTPTVALVGTHLLFWGWYTAHYHPAKLGPVLLFQGTVFTLFLGRSVLAHLVRKRPPNVEDLLTFFLNAVLFASAGYVPLSEHATYAPWLGVCATGLAIVYALFAWLVQWSLPDERTLLLASVAAAMGFLAAVFPLHFDAPWIAVGWAAQGLALWWFGLRTHDRALLGLGAAFLILAAGRLLFVDTLASAPHREPFIPIFNHYALPALAVCAALLAAAGIAYRFHPVPWTYSFLAMRIASIAGVLLLWMALSFEAYDYFITQANAQPFRQAVIAQGIEPEKQQPFMFERAAALRHSAQTALSITWALYAVLLLTAGIRFRSRPLRWLALALFGLTLGKVFLIDMQDLTGFYRVIAFLALALVMGAAAWTYQKVSRALLAPEVRS